MARNETELRIADLLDVRSRIERGVRKITFIQYFIYLIASLTLCILSGKLLLSIETQTECWAADSYS
jgi:hypothetical protein